MMHLITVLCVMLSVGFFTMFERKCLSYFQIRKGPNKVAFMGLAQPLADAMKLFLKEKVVSSKSIKWVFRLAPVVSLVLCFGGWFLYEQFIHFSEFFWSSFFYAMICGFAVFPVFMAGWGSNSKYAMLGSIRALAQTVSYEISFTLCLAFFLYLYFSCDFYSFYLIFYPLLFCFFSLFIWFITCLAETHRAPFDFAEGESELVSGYNVEYGGSDFAFLFIGEYGFILLSSCVCSLFFFGGWGDFLIFFYGIFWAKVVIFCYFFVIGRGALPRLRYDLLMSLLWKQLIPWITVLLIFLLSFLY